ncbi:hypothetical protein ACILPE_03680 [Capnocytophaga canimorsus]|uniref:hypothetical protein n=1 Tax=Capnocytophaga canimorsus TaxID=28188 RepID=UPI0037CD1C13
MLVAFVASCNRTETISEKKSFRKEFIGEKGIGVVREDFKNASFDVKQKLWIDKLEYLLNQDFDNEIRADIRVIKDFISDFGNEDKYLAFNQATIRLANNIPSNSLYCCTLLGAKLSMALKIEIFKSSNHTLARFIFSL